MPIYEYRCRACGDTFDRLRPSAEADAPLVCPAGHTDTTRLISAIARRPAAAPTSGLPMAGGGCCGGSCCS